MRVLSTLLLVVLIAGCNTAPLPVVLPTQPAPPVGGGSMVTVIQLDMQGSVLQKFSGIPMGEVDFEVYPLLRAANLTIGENAFTIDPNQQICIQPESGVIEFRGLRVEMGKRICITFEDKPRVENAA